MIEITDTEFFDIKQICTCGQLFRYKLEGENAVIHAQDKEIRVEKTQNGYKIFCGNNKLSKKNDDFIKNYFDLNKNYDIIYKELKNIADSEIFNEALNFGKGIRILQQDKFETIISFIISQNNNIPRIQKSIEDMCKKFGKNMGTFYSFPTIEELSKATVDDFKNMGLGYRAEYMVGAIKLLKTDEFNLNALQKLDTLALKQKLCLLKGVGPKVADCIALFGFNRFDCFPADTWIKHLYIEDFKGNAKDDAKKVSAYFTNKFGALSGYAQQYLYFYKREN